MRPIELVVDTSALIDGADPELGSAWETFRFLQGTYPMMAPVLMASEAGYFVHNKRPSVFGADAHERSVVHNTLVDGIELVFSDRDARAGCGALVASHGLTFYDTEFLELARAGDGRILLSEDGALRDAAKEVLGDERALSLAEAAELISAGKL